MRLSLVCAVALVALNALACSHDGPVFGAKSASHKNGAGGAASASGSDGIAQDQTTTSKNGRAAPPTIALDRPSNTIDLAAIPATGEAPLSIQIDGRDAKSFATGQFSVGATRVSARRLSGSVKTLTVSPPKGGCPFAFWNNPEHVLDLIAPNGSALGMQGSIGDNVVFTINYKAKPASPLDSPVLVLCGEAIAFDASDLKDLPQAKAKAVEPPSALRLTEGQYAAGAVRGVEFFYLDGVDQDIMWIFDHLEEPQTKARIQNVFGGLSHAGVNWIRILIGDWWGPTHYPDPKELPDRLNKLMSLGPEFTYEIMFVSPRGSDGNYLAASPYDSEKTYYQNWMQRLDRSHVGKIMISGDSDMENFASHRSWHTAMWPWFHATYPQVLAGYEVIFNGELERVNAETSWIVQNTPDVPYVSASVYFDIPGAGRWEPYAAQANALFSTYKAAAAGKPLWIDEYGHDIKPGATDDDQAYYYAGFLGAAVCQTKLSSPLFAWVAGNDGRSNGKPWFGLIERFEGDTPVWRQAFNSLMLYYRLQSCESTQLNAVPVASAPPPTVNTGPAVSPQTSACVAPTISGAGLGCEHNECIYLLGSHFTAGMRVDLYPSTITAGMPVSASVSATLGGDQASVTIRVPDQLLGELHGSGLSAVLAQPSAPNCWSAPQVVSGPAK